MSLRRFASLLALFVLVACSPSTPAAPTPAAAQPTPAAASNATSAPAAQQTTPLRVAFTPGHSTLPVTLHAIRHSVFHGN